MFRKFSTLALIGLLSLAVVAQDKKQDPPIPADTEIVTLPSGLKYSVLEKGKGEGSPVMGDSVTCHYRGWLNNGVVFDESYNKPGGAPAKFNVGGVIAGWNEALQLMNPGDKYKLTIPSKLAYGAQAQGGLIPANSDLTFIIELIAFKSEGRNVPSFPSLKSDDKSVMTLKNGLAIKAATSGQSDGAKIGKHDLIMLHYSFWNEAGAFVTSSRTSKTGAPVTVTSASFSKNVPFFASVTEKAQAGGSYNVKAPSELCFKDRPFGAQCPPNSTTIWSLEFNDVIPFDFDPKLERKKTESGLEYEIIRQGRVDGKRPTIDNEVLVRYSGWTKDGFNFDSSFKKGQAPADMPLNRLVQGWKEGLPLMTEGAIYRFRIPWKDGYGAGGNPRAGIPAKCDLVFYIELVGVKEPTPAK